MTAGYSGRALAAKLGVKPGHRLLISGAPAGFDLGPIDGSVTVHSRLSRASYDVVLAFCRDRVAAEQRFRTLPQRTTRSGALWLAWPKKASAVTTDLDENVIRSLGLATGLVDVKVCAVDETWSGLKFVLRVGDR